MRIIDEKGRLFGKINVIDRNLSASLFVKWVNRNKKSLWGGEK